MKYICLFLIAFLAVGCKPAPSHDQSTSSDQEKRAVSKSTNTSNQEASSVSAAILENGDAIIDAHQAEVTETQDQAIEAHEKEQLNLPDNKRSRWGYLGDGGALIEKSTNMRMRLEKKEIEKNGNSSIIIELKFTINKINVTPTFQNKG